MYKMLIKRCIDIILSLIGMIILIPIFIIIGIIIYKRISNKENK